MNIWAEKGTSRWDAPKEATATLRSAVCSVQCIKPFLRSSPDVGRWLGELTRCTVLMILTIGIRIVQRQKDLDSCWFVKCLALAKFFRYPFSQLTRYLVCWMAFGAWAKRHLSNQMYKIAAATAFVHGYIDLDIFKTSNLRGLYENPAASVMESEILQTCR